MSQSSIKYFLLFLFFSSQAFATSLSANENNVVFFVRVGDEDYKIQQNDAYKSFTPVSLNIENTKKELQNSFHLNEDALNILSLCGYLKGYEEKCMPFHFAQSEYSFSFSPYDKKGYDDQRQFQNIIYVNGDGNIIGNNNQIRR